MNRLEIYALVSLRAILENKANAAKDAAAAANSKLVDPTISFSRVGECSTNYEMGYSAAAASVYQEAANELTQFLDAMSESEATT